MTRTFKATGVAGLLIGTLVIGVLIAIPLLLLVGAAEVSAMALGAMPVIFGVLVVGSAILFGALSLLKKKRGLAGAGLLFTSVLFAALLSIWALAFTYESWGLLPVIVGLLLFGIGIVPIALLAAVVEGQWMTLGLLLALMACIHFYRVFGTNLLHLAGKRAIDGFTGSGAPPQDEGTIIEGTYREN